MKKRLFFLGVVFLVAGMAFAQQAQSVKGTYWAVNNTEPDMAALGAQTFQIYEFGETGYNVYLIVYTRRTETATLLEMYGAQVNRPQLLESGSYVQSGNTVTTTFDDVNVEFTVSAEFLTVNMSGDKLRKVSGLKVSEFPPELRH